MRLTGLRAEAFVHVCTMVSTLGIINKSFDISRWLMQLISERYWAV
jgi:hypothetical protein